MTLQLPLKPMVSYPNMADVLALHFMQLSDNSNESKAAVLMDTLIRMQALRNTLVKDEPFIRNALVSKTSSSRHGDAASNIPSQHSTIHDSIISYQKDMTEYFNTWTQIEQNLQQGKDRDYKVTGTNTAAITTIPNASFTWKSAFTSTSTGTRHKQESHASIGWERACVWYNLAALHLYQARQVKVSLTQENLSSREAYKEAIQLFQTTATLLEKLQDHIASLQKEKPSPSLFTTIDLSAPLLEFWKLYALAEAQACIYSMSKVDEKKTSILAILAQGVHQAFTDAWTASQHARLQHDDVELSKEQAQEWSRTCQRKALWANIEANFHQAVHERQQYNHGKEIARLRFTIQKYKAFEKKHLLSKDDDDYDCKQLYALLQDRIHVADRENYQTYHEVIPQEVEEIVGKVLSKCSGTASLPINL